MTDKQKQQIIDSGKAYFREIIIPKHLGNLKKLKLSDFNINPFTVNYLAAFLCGNTEPKSLAKALVYPRVLGTSISTSFGTHLQDFIAQVRQITSSGSAIPGIDIEFVDAIDKRKKYCQCKAGPNCINKDDVDTILIHFKQFKGIAKTNKLKVYDDDLVLGVLYGNPQKLSAHYKTVATTYPVYCGADFWEHITGDKNFYLRLAKAFGEVVEEEKIDGSQYIENAIEKITKEIEKKGII